MYNFRIAKQFDGGYKFELGDIKMFVEDYIVINNKHLFTTPKVIAYFNVEDNIYGVSNEPLKFETAEAFYDAIAQQYKIFTSNNTSGNLQNNTAMHQA